MNRGLICLTAVLLLLTASCQENDDLSSDKSSVNYGEYDTMVTFDLTFNKVDVETGVMPIQTNFAFSRTGDSGISALWYILFDKNGKAVPSASGEVMRHITQEIGQSVGELLPVGDYRAVFLAFKADGAEANDKVHSVTSVDQKLLEINGNADGIYLYYEGMLNVRSGGENRLKAILKPIVGEFKLDLQVESAEQLKEIRKMEVVFDKATAYLAFTPEGTYTTLSSTPLRGDVTTSGLFSLPTEGEDTSGKVIITLKGRDGKEEIRSYSFSNLPIRRGEQTTLSLSLDLSYNTMGTLYVTSDFAQATSKMIMFQDDEPASMYSDRNRRSFVVSSPLKATVHEKKLEVQFYSPIGIEDVDLYMQLSGTSEWLKMCHFDVMPRFQEVYFDFTPTIQTATYETLSGKMVTINAAPDMTNWDVKFMALSDDPHFQKLNTIKARWTVSFYNPSVNLAYASTPSVANVRHLLAFATNNAYMFSSDYFIQELEKYRGKLYASGAWEDDANWPNNPEVSKPINIDKLITDVYRVSKLTYFDLAKKNAAGGIGMTYPGGYLGWYPEFTLEHYTQLTSYNTQAMFHEFAHVLGYGDNVGNMTHNGTGWVLLCDDVYAKMFTEKELPYYSADLVDNGE